jgi:hypothetical protein
MRLSFYGDKLKPVPLVFTLLLASCATPPRIAVTTQVRKTSASAGRLTVTIKNVENRPTTPVLLEVSLRAGNGAPLRLIHPAAFVLNRQETREIIAPFVSEADNLEPVVELRIAQTGALLQPTALTRVPATAVPATPQPRGK